MRQEEEVLDWQTPPVQVPEQHCVPLVQVVPPLKQLVGWQVVPVTPLQKVEQHGVPLPTVQVVPLVRQLLAWQVPPMQKVEQQSVPVAQTEPLAEQQVPAAPVVLVHWVEQHCDAVGPVHAEALARHAGGGGGVVVVGEELEHAWIASATAAAATRTERMRRMDELP